MATAQLAEKIKKAESVINTAFHKWPINQIAVAWTGGKDSTVVLDLVRNVFKGKVPFRVFFNDSTIEFPEVYEFIDKITKKWQLDLIRVPHLEGDLLNYRKAKLKEDQMEIMRVAKINAINYAIAKYDIKAFISGIRWDEHEARSKEKFISPRATHTRVHPILQFTLDDIWSYIKQRQVPYVSLYDQGYKSLGEAPFTKPVDNPNAPERAGREATKEKVMARLRKLGYW